MVKLAKNITLPEEYWTKIDTMKDDELINSRSDVIVSILKPILFGNSTINVQENNKIEQKQTDYIGTSNTKTPPISNEGLQNSKHPHIIDNKPTEIPQKTELKQPDV